ncbi:MAG: 2-oxoacid:acceptor oxidoreductase family protein [candidate division Zixibacteria bacterium]|nr:2-oxoacid:acceptor oxidoreductase family protein [candidate division Zixibacteria bacterium]
MIEVMVYGRGGQGVVIASEILAAALFNEGKHVQAFPSFGAERRGAQVAAFMRSDEEKILLRCQIARPDHVIILSTSILETTDIGKIIKPGGWMVVNSAEPPDLSGQTIGFKLATVDAQEIAVKHGLGTRQAAIVNTAILGAFAKVTGAVKLESVLATIDQFVPAKSAENAEAAREAYQSAREVK